MSECFRTYFLRNYCLEKCSNFNDITIHNGISIYEVIRVFDSIPLFLDQHIARLINSAKLLDLEISVDKKRLAKSLIKLCNENNTTTGNVKLIMNYTSGDFYIYFIKHKYPAQQQYEQGVKTAFCHSERNNPNVKRVSELRGIADRLILEKNIYEVILVDKNGFITEGSRSNIFLIKEDTIYTSPAQNVLQGITREKILYICNEIHIAVKETAIHYSAASGFDAVFISGTSPKILPVSAIDNQQFSVSNKYMRQIMEGYNNLIEKYLCQNSPLFLQ